MNQFDIEDLLDKKLMEAEDDLERVFNRRLKTILDQLARMFEKYEKDGKLTSTEMVKYNRFDKEMARITQMLTDDYQQIVKDMRTLQETQYLEKYLLSAYLISQVQPPAAQGFSLPSPATIKEVLLNPIAELTLPKILQQHRNDTVRKINIELAQGIQAGESYWVMAKRLERVLGFSSNKARTVARTEAGRARSIAGEKVFEEASAYSKATKVWTSSLDTRVRKSHRKLDGQDADKNGVFHYKSNYTLAPRLWVGVDAASLSINCRCVVIYKINGKLPEYRRGRDYMDDKYQQKLADRIDQYMADESMTYKQAVKKATKELQPPSTVIPFVTYEEWYKEFASA